MTEDAEETETSDEQRDEESETDYWEDRDRYEPFDDEHLYEDWDDLAADPEEVSRLGRALEGLLPDVVKRGFDGLVKEDGLKGLVKERELPREAVGFILGQVDATKREVLRIVSREIRLFLRDVDLGGELTKLLTSVSFEIRTEVRFIPNDASGEPEIDNQVILRGEDGETKTLEELERDIVEARRQAGSDEDEGPSGSGDRDRKSGGGEAGEEDVRQRLRRRWGEMRRRTGEGDSESTNEDDD